MAATPIGADALPPGAPPALVRTVAVIDPATSSDPQLNGGLPPAVLGAPAIHGAPGTHSDMDAGD